MNDDRRKLLLLGTAALVGAGMGGSAGCIVTPDYTVQTVTDLINKIQTAVVAAMALACGTANKWVPTADTVLIVLEAILGTTLTTANLAAGIAIAQKVIDSIVSAGCPPAPATSLMVRAGGKDVPVNWY